MNLVRFLSLVLCAMGGAVIGLEVGNGNDWMPLVLVGILLNLGAWIGALGVYLEEDA